MNGNFIPVDIGEITTRLDILIEQGKNSLANNLIIEFFSNFTSQFLAFVSGLLVAYLTKKRERYGLHQKAMVKTEYLLGKHQDRINRLIYLLDNTISILTRGIFTHNRFNQLNINETIDLELANLHLINDLANYWLSVERVNHDLESINRLLETLQQIGISGIRPNQANFDHIISQMGTVKKYLSTLFIDENILLTAQVRELLAADKQISEFTRLLTRYNIPDLKISKRKILATSKKIRREMAERTKSDKERILKL